jgi:two-component sensor histidine kinase/ligand-binding sensor domain-containing protein
MLRLSADEGLSKSVGTAILQDDLGFMWIGTYDGLNRYDGADFRVFRPDPNDSTGLCDNYIQCLVEDARNVLWIGTKKGLNRYYPSTERFDRVLLTSGHSAVEITVLCADSSGRMWVGTDRGLCLLDRDMPPRWIRDPADPAGGSAGFRVTAISAGRNRLLTVGTEKGLYRLDPSGMEMRPIPFDGAANLRVRCLSAAAGDSLWVGTDKGAWMVAPAGSRCVRPPWPAWSRTIHRATAVYSMETDDFGRVWIGTWGRGVYRFDRADGTIAAVEESRSPQSLQFVNRILRDRGGMVWICTKTGVYLTDAYPKPFRAVTSHEPGRRNAQWDVTKVLVPDPFNADAVWASTDRGLVRILLSTGASRIIRDIPGLNRHSIHSLFMEPSGMLWLGTNGELFSFDVRTHRSRRYPEIRHPNPNVALLSYYSVCRDASGVLWLGTFENGLIRFEPKTGRTRFFAHDPADSASLPDDHIWTLFQDRQKRLWVGTDGGFSLLDPKSGTFRTWRSGDFPLISDRIRVITQDRGNRLWIGTDGGICRFDPDSSFIRCYSEKHGLPNHVIHGILEEPEHGDAAPSVWASTNRGLLRFDPSAGTWTSFGKEDGLRTVEFSRQCFCRTHSGLLVFGGFEGLTILDPARFIVNPHPPEVAFTDFQVFHQSVPIGKPFLGKILLPQSVSRCSRIVLTRRHELLDFEYTALLYPRSEKIRYQYRLDGFSPAWIDAQDRRFAVFSNLAPGDYVLHVRAASPDGIWSKRDAVMRITMLPSFWQRWSVRIAAFLLFTGGILLTGRRRTLGIQKRNRILRQFNEQLQKEVDERTRAEASLLKSQDLLKASLEEKQTLLRELYHRTKNNMQVISSMLRLRSKNVSQPQMKDILSEIENKIRSMALVHQKLYESGDLSHIRLKEYLESLVSLVQSSYTDRPDQIRISVEGQDVLVLIDTAIPCGLVVNELIVNAIKHAFPDGKPALIRVRIRLGPADELVIEVSDNGIGLPDGFDLSTDAHLGLDTVVQLVRHQLQGEIEFIRQPGLTCRIRLAEEQYKPRI